MQAPGNAQTKLDSGRKQVNAKQTRKKLFGILLLYHGTTNVYIPFFFTCYFAIGI
jgi:hypothetical protein